MAKSYLQKSNLSKSITWYFRNTKKINHWLLQPTKMPLQKPISRGHDMNPSIWWYCWLQCKFPQKNIIRYRKKKNTKKHINSKNGFNKILPLARNGLALVSRFLGVFSLQFSNFPPLCSARSVRCWPGQDSATASLAAMKKHQRIFPFKNGHQNKNGVAKKCHPSELPILRRWQYRHGMTLLA